MSVLKVMTRSLLVAGLASLVGLFLLSAYFLEHRPPGPHPELGFTYPFQQHGAVVYLTRPEHLLVRTLPWAFVVLVFSGAAIHANSRFGGR